MPAEYYIGGKSLFNLSREERIKYIKAMLLKDYDSIPYLRFKLGTGLRGTYQKADYQKNAKTFLELLIKSSETEPLEKQEVIEILRGAIKSIPDTEVSVKAKHDFIAEYFDFYKKSLTDIAYDESLQALLKPKIITSINLNTYKEAFKGEVNYSDYTVLSVGMLRELSKTNTQLNKQIEAVEKEYFEHDYEKCLEMVTKICSDLKTTGEPQAIAVANAILDAQKKCVDVDPAQNDTKRYFNTKLSQYILGKTKDLAFLNSINTISQRLLSKRVTSSTEAEEAIASIAELPNTAELITRDFILRAGSPKYQIKDRMIREGFENREDEALSGEISQIDLLSFNLGQLRSNSPNFRDELAMHAIRNRIVDVNRPREGQSGYTATEKRWRDTFISSISGHTFYTVAVLERYMRNYRNSALPRGEKDPILERDINNYLIAYVGTYAKRGYHSIHEVLDVLREPNIIQVFKDFGVTLNVAISPTILRYAMNDTLAYSKALSIKNVAQEVLKSKIKISEMMTMQPRALKEELHGIYEVISNLDPIDYISNHKKVLPYERILKELYLKHQDPDIKKQTHDVLKKIEEVNYVYKVETAIRTKNEAAIRRLLSDPLVKKNLKTPVIFGDQLIHLLASNGYNDLVLELINLGVDKNSFNRDGRTPLALAVEKGHLELVSKLLDLGASPTIKDKEGNTPFSIAVKLNRVSVAEKLLTIDAVAETINRPLGDSYLIHEAAVDGHTDMVAFLLKNGADPLKLDSSGYTPLVWAVTNNQVALVELLIEAMRNSGEQEFVKNQIQKAFTKAIVFGKVEVLDTLIASGAKINEPDQDGIPPIFHTLQKGGELALEYLLKKGVDVSATFQGHTPFDIVINSGNPDLMKTFLTFRESKPPEPVTFRAKAAAPKKEALPTSPAPVPKPTPKPGLKT